MNMNKIF